MSKLSEQTNQNFQTMMKDLLFGEQGYFNDVPANRKAAAIGIIDNTELHELGTCGNDIFPKEIKLYQVFKLSSEGKKVFAMMGRKWIEFFGTEDQGMEIWEKLRIKIDLYKECDIYLNVNLVESVHYFDTLEDMKAFINEELL